MPETACSLEAFTLAILQKYRCSSLSERISNGYVIYHALLVCLFLSFSLIASCSNCDTFSAASHMRTSTFYGLMMTMKIVVLRLDRNENVPQLARGDALQMGKISGLESMHGSLMRLQHGTVTSADHCGNRKLFTSTDMCPLTGQPQLHRGNS